jgi:hypothetical protein
MATLSIQFELNIWIAFAFSYFEIFIHSRSQIQVDEEISRIKSLDNLLRRAGHYKININQTISLLRELSKLKAQSIESASDLLLCRFNDPDASNDIICHFRSIASSWLVAKSTTYEAYIPEGFGIDTYRTRWLDAPHQEIDPLGMALLVDVLLWPLRVGFELTIVRENEAATHCEYPKIPVVLNDNDLSTKTTTIHLLYRPDHYDILYTNIYAGEKSSVALDALPQVTLKITRAEFDAHAFEESCQAPEIPPRRNLTTFTPQELNILPHLSNLRLTESGADSILGISELSRVLNVRTAVGQKTFEPENSLLTGLSDIAAFANVQAQREATFAAQRSRLKGTEPAAATTASSSTKESGSLGGSVLPSQEYSTKNERSQLKYAENMLQDTESPRILAANSKEVTKSSVEESLGSPNDSSTDYETDWEEEEEILDKEDAGAFVQHGSILSWGHLREGDSMKSILGRVKDELVTCLMKEFWDIAKQALSSKLRTYGSPSDSSSPSSDNNGALRTRTSYFTPGKRSREDRDGEPPEQDRERGSKKPKSTLTPLEISDEPPHFACPYRKHDPRKYNVNEWVACALTPQKGLHRVKFDILKPLGADK